MQRRYLLLLSLLLAALAVWAGDIYVSPDGHDRAAGTADDPLRSPHQALRMAREWRRLAVQHTVLPTVVTRQAYENIQGGVNIILRGGRYRMVEPLYIRPEDSGTADSPTRILGANGQEAVLCGDTTQQHTQVYPATGMARMADFSVADRTISVPAAAFSSLMDSGRATRQGDRWQPVCGSDRLEMVVHQRWAIAILRVKDWRIVGDKAVVSFMEPESRLEFEHPWPQPVIGGERGNSSFLLRTTVRRDGIERLVVVCGTAQQRVAYVSFEGIRFEDTAWNRPQHQGHVTLQGGFPVIDAYKLPHEGLPWAETLENQAWVERPVAAVQVTNAHHVDFRGCAFRRLGATALDFVTGISNCTVDGNNFEQIGGTAVMGGSFAESPREVHRPYTDLAAQCSQLTIRNNIIRHATTEDWGAVAIGCGYVTNVLIENNTVEHVNYSGICVGWGWTPDDTGMHHNVVRRNVVVDFARQLYDAGGIYTLSNQPGSMIEDNVIDRLGAAPYATNDRGFYIYLDAATDGYTVRNNWCPQPRFGDNHPGPAIVWGENGPQVTLQSEQ